MSSRVAWPTGRLGEHAYIKARIGWRGLSSSEYTDSGPYLIAGNHIIGGKVNWPSCDHISRRRYEESWEIALRPGDVILTKDGTIGRVAIIDTLPGLATINGTMMLVRPSTPLVPRYVYHYLTGAAFQKLVMDKVSGSSIPHIFQRDMQHLPIPIPPEVEQQRIADILDTADAAIQQTETLIAKLKRMRAGLLHDLLTCGLDERGQIRDPDVNSAQFQDTVAGKIPMEWRIATLGQTLTAIEAGKSPDCPDIPAGSGEWGVLKVSAIRPGGFQSSENKVVTNHAFINRDYEVREGDLLISRANTYELVGIVCLVTDPPPHLMLSDKTLRLKVDHSNALPTYLFQALQAPAVRRQIETYATGSSGSMKNISQEAIRSLTIPLPPLSEQGQIAQVIDFHDARIRSEETYRDKLKLLKQGLMDDLLTGRVRVPVAEEAAV